MLGTMTADFKKKLSMSVAILALLVAATLAWAQFHGTVGSTPRSLSNIELLHHKQKCPKYKKGSKKRQNCKEDCGFGPGGYGRPNDHPNHPNQCRDW
jgi:hypothetical protein